MTRAWQLVRVAVRTVAAQRSRSLLTMVSIAVGAFSIVVMYSLADSGLASLQRSFLEVGAARMLFVYEKAPERGRDKRSSYDEGLTTRDRAMLSELPHVTGHGVYVPMSRQDVIDDAGQAVRTDVVASDGGLFPLLRIRLAGGRAYDDDDDSARRPVCIVGHGLATRLWRGDALSHHVTVAGRRCEVVGQLVDDDRWGLQLGFDWEEVIFIPLHTMADSLPSLLHDSVTILQTDDVRQNALVAARATRRLDALHHGQDDFEVEDEARDDAKWNGIFALMKLIVGLIAGVALVIGGVGVMNVMLVGVTERRLEIGVRRAVGARASDISLQFFCEAAMLAGAGGASGALLGLAATVLANRFIHEQNGGWIAVTSMSAFSVAIAVAVAIGLLFGVAPARLAAKLDPVVAMRS